MGNPIRPAILDGIEFDALITSTETHSSDVPDYPCEEGYSVHDTIVTKPMELSLTLFLTNNPVTWYNRLGNTSDRVQVVEESLRALFAARKAMTVLTATDKFTNMCITSVSINKSKENGTGRGIDVSLKQVSITSTSTTTVPASYGLSGETMSNAGNAGTTGVTENSSSGGSSTTTESSEETSASKSKASLLYNAASSLGLFKEE